MSVGQETHANIGRPSTQTELNPSQKVNNYAAIAASLLIIFGAILSFLYGLWDTNKMAEANQKDLQDHKIEQSQVIEKTEDDLKETIDREADRLTAQIQTTEATLRAQALEREKRHQEFKERCLTLIENQQKMLNNHAVTMARTETTLENLQKDTAQMRKLMEKDAKNW